MGLDSKDIVPAVVLPMDTVNQMLGTVEKMSRQIELLSQVGGLPTKGNGLEWASCSTIGERYDMSPSNAFKLLAGGVEAKRIKVIRPGGNGTAKYCLTDVQKYFEETSTEESSRGKALNQRKRRKESA